MGEVCQEGSGAQMRRLEESGDGYAVAWHPRRCCGVFTRSCFAGAAGSATQRGTRRHMGGRRGSCACARKSGSWRSRTPHSRRIRAVRSCGD